MRWPKPDELQRWTPDDQVVFRKWRQVVMLFYGAVFCLLAATSFFAFRHNGHAFPDVMAARPQVAPPSLGTPLSATYRGR
jgi:hypothetical protein